MNRCLCQRPPWRGDGGSWGSSTPSKALLESRLSGAVSDLRLLRPGATLLQPDGRQSKVPVVLPHSEMLPKDFSSFCPEFEVGDEALWTLIGVLRNTGHDW